MSIVRAGAANWNASMNSIYELLGEVVARTHPGGGDAASRQRHVRNAALVLNEVVHDFSKSDQFTGKRGILYWIVRKPDATLVTYAAGKNPTTWGGGIGPLAPGDTKKLLEDLSPEEMKSSRLLYKEQIIAGLIKSMFGNDESARLNEALASDKTREDLVADAAIFGGAAMTPAQALARLMREVVYPPGCTPGIDHAAADLAGAYAAAAHSNELPKLAQTTEPPPAAAAAAAAPALPSTGDILGRLIKSRGFSPGSGCVIVATMDCVPKSIHNAWNSIAASSFGLESLYLVFASLATALADPGTGHLVRKTKLREGQFIARECKQPTTAAPASLASTVSPGDVAGARVYRFYSRPYNTQTYLLSQWAEDAEGLASDHSVNVKTFCFRNGSPSPADENTNQEVASVDAGSCEDNIAAGMSAKDTPFSRTNVMLREAFTFRNSGDYLPRVQSWDTAGGASAKDFLAFEKKKGGDENQALTPHVVVKAPLTGPEATFPGGCTSTWGNGELGAGSEVWLQVQNAKPGSDGVMKLGQTGPLGTYGLKTALNLRELYKQKLAMYVFFTIDILAFIRAITSFVPAFLSTVARNAAERPADSGAMAGGMMSDDEDSEEQLDTLFAFIPDGYDDDGIPQLPGKFYARADGEEERFSEWQVGNEAELDAIVRWLQSLSLATVCEPPGAAAPADVGASADVGAAAPATPPQESRTGSQGLSPAPLVTPPRGVAVVPLERGEAPPRAGPGFYPSPGYSQGGPSSQDSSLGASAAASQFGLSQGSASQFGLSQGSASQSGTSQVDTSVGGPADKSAERGSPDKKKPKLDGGSRKKRKNTRKPVRKPRRKMRTFRKKRPKKNKTRVKKRKANKKKKTTRRK